MQTRLVRFALVADAIATAATGALMAAAAGLLADFTGIPATFSMPVGLGLIAFAAFVGWVSSRVDISRGLTMLVVGINALWVLGSVAVMAMGVWPLSMLGVVFVIVQAAAVAILAILQEVGLGRASARAAA